MELIDNVYQILFYSSIFYLVRMISIMLFKFKAFQKARSEEDEEKARKIVFTLQKREEYLLMISIGIILAYLF